MTKNTATAAARTAPRVSRANQSVPFNAPRALAAASEPPVLFPADMSTDDLRRAISLAGPVDQAVDQAVDVSRVKSVESIGRRTNGLATTVRETLALVVGDVHMDQVNPADVTGLIHTWATGCACPAGRGRKCVCGLRPETKTDGAVTLYGTGVDTLTTAARRGIAAAIKDLAAFSPAPAPVDADTDGADTDDAPEVDDAPDYLALVVQAASTARANGVDAADILAAVAAALI